MEIIYTDGIVINEKYISPSRKEITLITSNSGIITSLIKDIKYKKSKNFLSDNLLCYSDFAMDNTRNKTILETHVKETFWKLRCNKEKLALAHYFCDLILNLIANNQENSNEILKLLLSTLQNLETDSVSSKILKSMFEIRLLALSGHIPGLLSCSCCGQAENDNFYFVPSKDGIVCNTCVTDLNLKGFKSPKNIISAMQYAINSELNKIFSFELPEKYQKDLCKISELYSVKCVEKFLKSLDLYNQLRVK